MEGKTVILSVLIMSFFMAQIRVEGRVRVCCPSSGARTTFNLCFALGSSKLTCARASGCQMVSGTCPGGFNNDILKNSGDAVSEYCKLGCTSSVCIALTTLQNSDASEIVNGAVEKCTEACSTLCTKGSKQALETLA